MNTVDRILEQANERQKRLITFMFSMFVIVVVITCLALIFYFALGEKQIQRIFLLSDDLIFFLNMFVNTFIYVIPAFLVAMLGAVVRLLLSSSDNLIDHIRIIWGSGLIGILTFIALKSGIILDLIGANAENSLVLNNEQKIKDFYRSMLMCMLAGMFSTNVLITLEERVKYLLNESKKPQ